MPRAALTPEHQARVDAIGVGSIRRQQQIAAERESGTPTQREREVLSLGAEGLTADEIAAVLFITVGVVRDHQKNLRRKCGARNMAHAVAIGLRRRWIS
jgi:DNA-binding CsgD family transcriptional regulator